jgi:hypothetical protein
MEYIATTLTATTKAGTVYPVYVRAAGKGTPLYYIDIDYAWKRIGRGSCQGIDNAAQALRDAANGCPVHLAAANEVELRKLPV